MTDVILNTGDTAWVLASTALVLLMTPGLALFYGGMVRAKSVLNMMLMSMITIGIVSVLWVIYGFKLALAISMFVKISSLNFKILAFLSGFMKI